MRRATEIARRLSQLHHKGDSGQPTPPETSSLWPRFKKIRWAIIQALTVDSPDIYRKLNLIKWNGYDDGICDYNAIIKGKVLGISLNLRLKGTQVPNQPMLIADKTVQMKLIYMTKQYLETTGDFTSTDGRRGAVEFHLEDGQTLCQAYWLETLNDQLRLEQVVNSQRQVFDAEKLAPDRQDRINIPGTNIFVNRIRVNN